MLRAECLHAAPCPVRRSLLKDSHDGKAELGGSRRIEMRTKGERSARKKADRPEKCGPFLPTPPRPLGG